MELHLGRRLTPHEVVHHKDHDRRNNALENLEVMIDGEHSSMHRKQDVSSRKRLANGTFACA